jgi:hypothetical protein
MVGIAYSYLRFSTSERGAGDSADGSNQWRRNTQRPKISGSTSRFRFVIWVSAPTVGATPRTARFEPS